MVVDAGELRSEWRKWINCFGDVKVMLFSAVAAAPSVTFTIPIVHFVAWSTARVRFFCTFIINRIEKVDRDDMLQVGSLYATPLLFVLCLAPLFVSLHVKNRNLTIRRENRWFVAHSWCEPVRAKTNALMPRRLTNRSWLHEYLQLPNYETLWSLEYVEAEG